jgi:hypothetical protein
MMCAVADHNSSDGASASNEQGVLANLPRTRPQRASARRAAARDGTPTATRTPRARSSAPRERRSPRARTATSAKRVKQPQQTAPRQGFECESEATGSVQPPGAAELLTSAFEVVGELAKAGVSRSERVIKDVISRLPLT